MKNTEQQKRDRAVIDRLKMYLEFFPRQVVAEMAIKTLDVQDYARFIVETELTHDQLERFHEIKANSASRTAV